MTEDSSNWTPARLLNQNLRVDRSKLTKQEKLLCKLGFHKWVRHTDYGWDWGTSIWCPRCDSEDEW